MANLDGLWWLLLLVGPLLFLQRLLHREIQAVFLLLTRRVDISLVLFSLLFFPGILLHEISHYLMARLLGVRVGGFSILPRIIPGTKDGQVDKAAHLQLGFVLTSRTDIVRDGLIGTAPLLSGAGFVTYAGLVQLGLNSLWVDILHTNSTILVANLSQVYARSDFWLWFYLIISVSSTMLPSASDRRAWLPLAVVFGFLLGLGLLAGVGPWMLEHLAPTLNQALRALASVIGISVAVHAVLIGPIYLLQRILTRITGFDVV